MGMIHFEKPYADTIPEAAEQVSFGDMSRRSGKKRLVYRDSAAVAPRTR
jgi:hypothetical protein